MEKKVLVVDKNGNGDFLSVADAVNAAPEKGSCKIYIKKGIYKEKLIVDKPYVFFEGEDIKDTVLTYDDGAFMKDETGEPMGTFKTASLHILRSAEGFRAENLTIENNAGDGRTVGQAVALYLDCDKAVIKNCRLLAKQDTLLTAPMHEDIAIEPTILNRQFFENCYIEGDVDFIFGGATAVFKDCEIFSLDRGLDINGYITAACTAQKIKYGYVFFNCKLTSNAPDKTVYLGRPWREFAKTVYIECEFGKHIFESGFSIWNKTDRHKTCYYAQYKCFGDGACEDKAVEWSHILTDEEAKEYNLKNIFGDWMPR